MTGTARRLTAVAVLALLPLGAAACGSGLDAQTSLEHASVNGTSANVGTMELRDAYLVGPASTQSTLYVALYNTGAQTDQLTGVSSPDFTTVTFPGTTGQVMVPAVSGAALLTAHTQGITVAGITAPLTVGQMVPVTFTFAKAGSVTILLPVEGRNGQAPVASPGASSTPVPQL